MKHSALLLFALAAVVGLTACQTGVTGSAASVGFVAPSQDSVYEVAAGILAQRGMPVDRDESSKENGIIITRWKTSLQPFSGQGHRDRATVTILPVAGQPNHFQTETQVVRQRNANMTQPGNPIVADWGSDDRVPELEIMINQRIELYFLPGRPSEAFRDAYGMR